MQTLIATQTTKAYKRGDELILLLEIGEDVVLKNPLTGHFVVGLRVDFIKKKETEYEIRNSNQPVARQDHL